MSLQSRSTKRKKTKKNKSKKIGNLINSFTSNGIVFERNVDRRKNTKTDLSTWPSCIIAGFSKDNEIFIEYPDGPHLDDISSFFSAMQQGDPFEISNAVYDNGTSFPSKALEGSYKFIAYLNNNHIVAEKDKPLDEEMIQKRLQGRMIQKCPQYSKTAKPKSSRKSSKIINFLNDPNFTNMNMQPGDLLELKGSLYNDDIYTVLTVESLPDGSQQINVTPPVKSDENRIGKFTSFSHYRNQIKYDSPEQIAEERATTAAPSPTPTRTTASPMRSAPSAPSSPSMPSRSSGGGGGGGYGY
jgi:hypothetical protein